MTNNGLSAYDFYLETDGVKKGFLLASDEQGVKQYQVGLTPLLAPQTRFSANNLYEGQPPEVTLVIAAETWVRGAGYEDYKTNNPETDDPHNLTLYNYSRGVDLSVPGQVILSPKRNLALDSNGDEVSSAPLQYITTSFGTFLITEDVIYQWDTDDKCWIERDSSGSFGRGACEFNGNLFVPRGPSPYIYSSDGTTWTASGLTDDNADCFCTRGDDGDATSPTLNVLVKLYDGQVSVNTDGTGSSNQWGAADTIGPSNETAKWVVPADDALLIFKTEGIYRYDFLNVDDIWKAQYLKDDNANYVFQWRNGLFYANYGDRLLEYDPIENTLEYVYPPEDSDSTEIKGAITGIGGDDDNLYLTIQNRTGDTYVMKGKPGEAWHTWAFPVGSAETDGVPSAAANDSEVGTNAWSDVNNALVLDGQFATCSTIGTTQFLRITNMGFAVPSDASIEGIVARVVRKNGVSTTQSFTTAGSHSFTVPIDVTSIVVDMAGGQGGNAAASGGNGGRVQTTIAVTPGESLQINVGGSIASTSGGTNGGGTGGTGGPTNGRGGGGASDIRQGGTALANRIVVAGGGGGAGGLGLASLPGGAGGAGGQIGSSGVGVSNNPGTSSQGGNGGTASAGGAGGKGGTFPGGTAGGNGTNGQLGIGGNGGAGGSLQGGGGGGGGGGYYGGGGGGGGSVTDDGGTAFGGAGGGGGSSYSNAPATFTSGFQPGNGYVTLSWDNGDVTDSTVKLFYSGAAIGDNKASSSAWSTDSETVTYGGGTDLWGYALTPAIVNDTTFGIGLSAEVAASAEASIDFMTVTVFYRTPGATRVSEALYVAGPSYIEPNNPVVLTGYGEGSVYYILPQSNLRPQDDPAYRYETEFGTDGAIVVGPWTDSGAAAYPKFLNRATILGTNMSAGKPVSLNYEADNGSLNNLLVATSNGLSAVNVIDDEVSYHRIRYVVELSTTGDTTSPILFGWTIQSSPNAPRYRRWDIIATLTNNQPLRDKNIDYWQDSNVTEDFLFSSVTKRVTYTDPRGRRFIVRLFDVQSLGFTRQKIGNEERLAPTYQIQLIEIAPVTVTINSLVYGTDAWNDNRNWS